MYLIVDLEATCWPDYNAGHKGQNEIIEIGAVLVTKFALENGVPDFIDLDQRFHFQSFVKPKRNPVLSDYCKELTEIIQASVDLAPPLPEVLRSMQTWIKVNFGFKMNRLRFCSWGRYDLHQMRHDFNVYGHRLRYGEWFGEHRSLKHEFADRHGIKPCGMKKALKILKLPLFGSHHRALDDAKNIARIFIKEWGGNRVSLPGFGEVIENGTQQ